jgi:N-acetylmuramoyl-L-alanine amidase
MQAFLRVIAILFFCVQHVAAQELNALARVDPAQSEMTDTQDGAKLSLALSQGVPFRVFTLDEPARVVIDFNEVAWQGVDPQMILPQPGRIAAIRFGTFRPGWSRFIAELAEPLQPEDISMSVDAGTGTARLELTLVPVTAEVFANSAGTPAAAAWVGEKTAHQALPVDKDHFVVVLDPGHGGIDPGAERDGISEKALMLSYARALRDVLRRNGVDVVMTREEDVFVPLQERVAVAQRMQADLLLSLHADNLSQGGAKGATVYLLSAEASDAASAQLAARHNRSDLLAGVDLSGADDQVTGVLLDLARQETAPRSKLLAETLINHMSLAGGPMNRRPLRHAGFAVLKSADIPSVLIEVGFLSSDRDLENLRDPDWRAGMVAAIGKAILTWRDLEAARAPLVRK